MHIAQGVLRAINVNKLTSTGCVFKFWVADWFAQLNNKMDGDLKKIRMIGQYMIEIWKAIGTSCVIDGNINMAVCFVLCMTAFSKSYVLRRGARHC
jgi:tyrosyl-tRNA synthetase